MYIAGHAGLSTAISLKQRQTSESKELFAGAVNSPALKNLSNIKSIIIMYSWQHVAQSQCSAQKFLSGGLKLT